MGDTIQMRMIMFYSPAKVSLEGNPRMILGPVRNQRFLGWYTGG